jgi:hypothetical protein
MASKTASMRASFVRSIRNNEELKSLRQQIADLRVARHATQAFHESTVRAANIAINYAYWSRYQDRYAWYSTPYLGYWDSYYGTYTGGWGWSR